MAYQTKKSKKTLQDTLLSRNRNIKIIYNFSEFLKSLDIEKGSDAMLSMLVRFAIEAIQATRGSLVRLDQSKTSFRYTNTFIYRDGYILPENYEEHFDKIKIQNFPLIELSMKKQTPLLIQDVKKEKLYNKECDAILELETHSLIHIPLIVDEKLFGILEIASATREFTENDVEVLMIISNIVTSTLENARLFSWAISDNITGLANRHFFFKSLETETKRSKRYNHPFSIIMLDLDKFKDINDTYGHTFGDRVLSSLSDILKSTVRDDIDLPARYGGDEFIILIPQTNIEAAAKLAQRIIEKVRSNILYYNDNEVQYKISMGLASYPEDAKKPEELINCADKALYFSKEHGRNRYEIYKNIKNKNKKRKNKKTIRKKK